MMCRSLFRGGGALSVLFTAGLLWLAGAGVARAQVAGPNWLGGGGPTAQNPGFGLSGGQLGGGFGAPSATIAEDVTQCPEATPIQASCEFPSFVFPGDAYDIRATLDNLPNATQWFKALANGKVQLSFAPGATCAEMGSSAERPHLFTVPLPAATVTQELFGQRALALGAVAFEQSLINSALPPPAFADVNFELSTSVFQNGAALHVSGNASLCPAGSLALELTNTDSATAPGSNTLCVDIPSPVISQLNINGTVVIACAVQAR